MMDKSQNCAIIVIPTERSVGNGDFFMSKYSVRKPYTVLVGVLLIIVLGVVSVTRMTADLLPNMSFPYVVVITTYPGGTPEQW